MFLKKVLPAVSISIGLLALGNLSSGPAKKHIVKNVVLERDFGTLTEGYGETRQSIGLTANNAVSGIFASDKTSSWTIPVTQANGLT